MKVAAIMQPTYLGWCGYFDLLDQADVMILDDRAAISTKSWQTRNRIRQCDGTLTWLTIPTHAHQGQSLNEILIANEHGWERKHIKTLGAAYRHAPHFDLLNNLCIEIDRRYSYLTTLTAACINACALAAGFDDFNLVLASELGPLRPGRLERLEDMLKATKARVLLDTAGARTVLGVDRIGKYPIRWHHYEPQPYSQGGQPWMPYLSIVDMIAWHGYDSLDIIRAGRTESAAA